MSERRCGTRPPTSPFEHVVNASRVRLSVIATTDGQSEWDGLVAAAKAYAPYLDQWDKFKFQTEYGPVYVTIGRSDLYPDSFETVS